MPKTPTKIRQQTNARMKKYKGKIVQMLNDTPAELQERFLSDYKWSVSKSANGNPVITIDLSVDVERDLKAYAESCGSTLDVYLREVSRVLARRVRFQR